MKIYTKTGDKGQTSLVGGERTDKHDARIEAYGSIDELNSMVGLVISCLPLSLEGMKADLHTMQHHLLDIGSELASITDKQVKGMKIPHVTDKKVEWLERKIDSYTEELEKLTQFILPGGTETAARLHLSRAICRRAERRIIELTTEHEVNPILTKYINRLSDYLFTAARLANKRASTPDIFWQKEK